MKMEKLERLWKQIQPNYIWWALALGAVLLALSVYIEMKYPEWMPVSRRLSEAGMAVLVSGVFASLLKAYQFAGVFQEELDKFFVSPAVTSKLREAMMYGREDAKVLQKAMEHLARKLFSDIPIDEIASAATNLLSTRTNYSVRDFRRRIVICDYDPSTQNVTVSDYLYMKIIAHEKTVFHGNYEGPAFAKDRLKIDRLHLSEDGNQRDIRSSVRYTDNGVSFNFDIFPGKNYELTRHWVSTYQLSLDPIIQTQFTRFCHGQELEVLNRVPGKMDFAVQFMNHDRPPPGRDVSVDTTEVARQYTVDRLTFPLQGFIVTLNPR